MVDVGNKNSKENGVISPIIYTPDLIRQTLDLLIVVEKCGLIILIQW